MESTENTYNKFIDNGDSDYQKVGWGSVESQVKRFDVLSSIDNLNDCTILDVGCGLGSLYEYLLKRHLCSSYVGTDVNIKMIKLAKEKYPDIDFIHTDLLSDSNKLTKSKFDYIFLSGALNLSTDNHEKNIRSMMKKMFQMSNKGVAMNFLSTYSDYYTAGEYYTNPEKILHEAMQLSRKVVLRHDYMPHDFTIFIYH